MSKIKNGGLDQYGAEPFEQQQCGTAGGEWLNLKHLSKHLSSGGRSRPLPDQLDSFSALTLLVWSSGQ